MHHITRARTGALLVLAVLAAGLALAGPNPVQAAGPCETLHWPARGAANTVATGNRLDDGPWGVNGRKWRYDEWDAYCAANATGRPLLARISSQPRMMWFGHWYSHSPASRSFVGTSVRDYVANAQNGNPNVIVHLAAFRLWPRGEDAKHIPLTAAEQTAYRSWMNALIAGIGRSRVAVVLEPDLGIAGWNPAVKDRAVRLGLVRWASQRFQQSAPNASVYLDGSSADWLSVDKAAWMLKTAGVQHVRGFALGATHYSPLGSEIVYARNVSERLRALGVPGRKAVIDTSDNGRGFTMSQFYAKYGPRTDYGSNTTCRNSPTTSHCGTWFDNAYVCTPTRTSTCVTLGVPPTWRVTDRIGTEPMRTYARSYVDGYTWFGRSWLYAQATPYKLPRALAMAGSTPFQ